MEPRLLIGGEWLCGTGNDCEVEDPATCTVVGLVTQASMQQVDEAVAAARAAFDGWAATAVVQRVAFLRRLHALLEERADLFAALINREQGSPLGVARKLHVDVPLAVLAQTADALEQFSFRSELGNSIILRE